MRKIENLPSKLKNMDVPPKQLYLLGELPKEGNKVLAVVGSRKYTSYGKSICEKLISQLSGYPITIVSGLAIGIDSISHKAALKSGLQTFSVVGSGLNDKVLYPTQNFNLAKQITEKGGGVASEYDPDTKAMPYMFPERNRIIVGMSDAVLVIEAKAKSGTLITARLTAESGKDLMVIPNKMFDSLSEGSNELIKDGAHMITSVDDILDILDIEKDSVEHKIDLTSEEELIYNLLKENPSIDEAFEKTDISISTFQSTLTNLEVKGLIKERGGVVDILN